MKVLMINGSPRANGNTSIALNEMKTVFEKEGVVLEDVLKKAFAGGPGPDVDGQDGPGGPRGPGGPEGAK